MSQNADLTKTEKVDFVGNKVNFLVEQIKAMYPTAKSYHNNKSTAVHLIMSCMSLTPAEANQAIAKIEKDLNVAEYIEKLNRTEQ